MPYIEMLTLSQWLLVLMCGLFIGMSKTGFSGFGLLVVPLLASVFGGKPSTGFLLPMLVMADIFAVSWFRRHANWKYVFKPMPWAIIGLLIGLYVGEQISAEGFKQLIAACILGGIIVLLWNDFRKKKEVSHAPWFAALFGLVGGFSTMIGNAAGPIMAVYLLSTRIPRDNYIGTTAWFFMILNVTKLPLQAFVWHNITGDTLLFDLCLLPSIALGAWLGMVWVKKIPEKAYRIVIVVFTTLSSLALFL
jgi:uncharacterized membrane protein YfcA